MKSDHIVFLSNRTELTNTGVLLVPDGQKSKVKTMSREQCRFCIFSKLQTARALKGSGQCILKWAVVRLYQKDVLTVLSAYTSVTDSMELALSLNGPLR